MTKEEAFELLESVLLHLYNRRIGEDGYTLHDWTKSVTIINRAMQSLAIELPLLYLEKIEGLHGDVTDEMMGIQPEVEIANPVTT